MPSNDRFYIFGSFIHLFSVAVICFPSSGSLLMGRLKQLVHAFCQPNSHVYIIEIGISIMLVTHLKITFGHPTAKIDWDKIISKREVN